MSNMEFRVQRLEEDHYFQEEFIQELNAVVTSQQDQISKLQKEIVQIKQELRILRELVQEKPANIAPPHYLEKISIF